jgi:diguanylate cyclase (GGDEF)-like protein/PAS domain S-box-containing protein
LGVSTYDAIGDPVLVISPDGILIDANAASEAVLGWAVADRIGRSVFDLIHPDDLEFAIGALDSTVGKSAAPLIDVRLATSDGGWRHMELRGNDQRHNPAIGGVVVVARDMSDRRRLEIAGNDVSRLATLMQYSSSLLFALDSNTRVVSINRAVTSTLGWDPLHIQGTPFVELMAAVERGPVLATISALAPNESSTLDVVFTHEDRTTDVVVEFTITNLVNDPAFNGYLVSGHLAVRLRDARQRAEFLADHDLLTGVFTRDAIQRELSNRCTRAATASRAVSVLLVEFDRFGDVNELLGQAVGDKLLMEAAARLESSMPAGSVIGRYGGDEFIVVSVSDSPHYLAELRQRATAAMSQPLRFDGATVPFRMSFGGATGTGVPGPALLAEASAELAAVQRIKRGDRSEERRTLSRRELADDLIAALAHDDIRPWYQPIYSLSDHTVVAFEALTRWIHPTRGVLAPGEFLGLIDALGQQRTFDDSMLRLACQDLAASDGSVNARLFINMSPTQLTDPLFPRRLRDIAAEAGVDVHRLGIEITEGDLLRGPAALTHSVEALRAMGVHVAIDDFGTGWSSLGRLLDVRCDEIKIDRRFVSSLDHDEHAVTMISAMIAIATAIGATTTAEGVETRAHEDRLRQLGCTHAQGFLYAEAMPTASAFALVGSHGSRA